MWLSVSYSEFPTPYSSMFCSSWLLRTVLYTKLDRPMLGVEKILLRSQHIEFTANVVISALLRMSCSIQQYVLLEMPYLKQYLYTKLGRPYGVDEILLRLERIEFKANMVIRALLQMPYSVQHYVLLEISYLEQYLYTKLGRPIMGRENLTPVGTHRIQYRCGYPCLTLNALLCIAVCSARDALLGIVSVDEAGQAYMGQRIQEMRLFGVGHSQQDLRLYRAIRSEAQLCPTPNISIQHKILLQ